MEDQVDDHMSSSRDNAEGQFGSLTSPTSFCLTSGVSEDRCEPPDPNVGKPFQFFRAFALASVEACKAELGILLGGDHSKLIRNLATIKAS